ncbi:MAG TPA: ATP-binding cassette domain-containing protein, partial [Methanoregulaceae archaeon]|nr:ATP-binding cassette domain-containing protein [Methanoregulaceae archaeon]
MILTVAGLSFRYNGLKILEEVEFRVNRHEILAILGPNGVGKTTLCYDLAAALIRRG